MPMVTTFAKQRAAQHELHFPEVDAAHMERYHPNGSNEFGGRLECVPCGIPDVTSDGMYHSMDPEPGWRCRRCFDRLVFRRKPWDEQTYEEIQQNHLMDHSAGWYGFRFDQTDHMHRGSEVVRADQ